MKFKFLLLTSVFYVSNMFAAEWGYEKHNGPKVWGKLDKKFILCQTGKEQSPINVVDSETKKAKNELFLLYGTDSKKVLNNGHGIKVEFGDAGNTTFKGKRYKLLQLHFHTPSETTIEGVRYPMEMHLVHKSKDDKLLVVGVLFKEGAENEELNAVISKSSTKINDPQPLSNLHIVELLPSKYNYYAFDGSLTTPPCNENVQWIILKTPVEASAKQLNAFQSILHNVARDTQPVNNRVIYSAP